MIINGPTLLESRPMKDMLDGKVRHNGVTHGLSEAGYDIRLRQTIWFKPSTNSVQLRNRDGSLEVAQPGRFIIASAMEEFRMPDNLTGVVHDKSTWARKGLSVFNTVIEPGWKGFLTLELVYHGSEELILAAGTGIAQVVFHEILHGIAYKGRYQSQADRPVAAIEA